MSANATVGGALRDSASEGVEREAGLPPGTLAALADELWANRGKSLVLATAMNQSVAKQQIASLYLSFYSRMPRPDEMEEAEQALKTGLSLSDLTWVLFNSREFIFVQ